MTCSETILRDDHDLISRIGVPMTFAKDEEIYGQGERADLVYRMISGTVRTSPGRLAM